MNLLYLFDIHIHNTLSKAFEYCLHHQTSDVAIPELCFELWAVHAYPSGDPHIYTHRHIAVTHHLVTFITVYVDRHLLFCCSFHHVLPLDTSR